MQVSVEIPAELEAVAMARDLVARVVDDSSVSTDRVDDVRLLVSEVVTNALRHAGLDDSGSIALAVDVSHDRVRVEVADRGPGFDPGALREPSVDQVGGWGLVLVEQLSDRWGVERNDPNLVWFELRL
jgi:anti-sigma regulatory factor (Ser/Thr protein kinase)